MRNGFFQVGCAKNSTFIRLVLPVDGGQKVNANDLGNYLNAKGINFDGKLLLKGIADADACGKPEFAFVINNEAITEIRESYNLTIRPDKMAAMVRFFPPSIRGERMKVDEILGDLAFRGIKYGIKKDELEAFMNKPVYNTEFTVAIGDAPVQGRDAFVEYFFKTDLTAKPALNEDGSVDFFNLDTMCKCKKGDILARLHPEEHGKDGCNIFGEVIKPREVKKEILRFGRNVAVSEDKTVAMSEVDGHVTLVENRIFVSNVYQVENVDPSTGNIEYDGSVRVNGNVASNYSIKAKGNIEVRGVVEGATLEAEGDIIIARGMNGMAKGVLKAGGNIVSKYLENATVYAEGYISCESILHSNVNSGADVQVTGRKGFITGGKVTATNCITVKTLGSEMGADTIVEVGMDPNVKIRMAELQKIIVENKKSIDTTHPMLTATLQKIQGGAKLRPDQLKYFQDTLASENEKKQQMEEAIAELETLQDQMDAGDSAHIDVTGEVFSGTKINISGATMVVQNPMTYCKFVKSQGDVRMTSL